MINNFKKVVIAASIVALSATATAQENLRLGHYFPAEDFRGKTAQYFADAVEQDMFNVQVYPSESLVKGRDGFNATARGTVDIYSLFGGYVVGSIDLMRIFTVPFPPDELTDRKLLEFANDERTLEVLNSEFERSNIKLLGFINSSGQTTVFLANSIDSLADLEGERIRGVGGYTDPALQDLGASVVFMSAAEQFLQLQTGGVDGVITTDSSYVNLGLSEVAPIMMDGSIVRTPYPLIMNKRKWDSLTSEQQEVLMAAAADTVAWSMENFEAESERLGESVRSEASSIYTLSGEDKEQASLIRDKYLNQFTEEYGEKGERLVELYNEYL